MKAPAINPRPGDQPPDPAFPVLGLVRAGSSLPLLMQGRVFWWRLTSRTAEFASSVRYLKGHYYKSLPGHYLGEHQDAHLWSWPAYKVDLILDPTPEQIAEELRQVEEP